MKFDLGAIGKGYALDDLTLLLKEMEVSNYAINIGNSTVLVRGRSKEKEYWGFTLSSTQEEVPLELNDIAVSASGTFYQGHHIFDPRTGLNSFEKLYDRVWVASKSAAVSDAYATACFLLVRVPHGRDLKQSENDKTHFTASSDKWHHRFLTG